MPHLRAGIALWNYAHATAEHVFGVKHGDGKAEKLLGELRNAHRSA